MSSFGPACGGDTSPTTSESGGQTETSAAETAMTGESGESGTSDPTTGATSDASTGTTVDTSATSDASTGTSGDETGGELPDCSVFDGDMAACQAMVGCVWEYEAELCFVDCTMLLDQATCEKAMICSWFDSVCYPPI